MTVPTIKTGTSDYEQLCVLITFESKMLCLLAEQRWEILTASDAELVAWELGWEYASDISGLSLSCADVLSSINIIGEELLPGGWVDAVQTGIDDRIRYERQVWKAEEKYPAGDNNIERHNMTFRRLYGSPDDSAGYVFIQTALPRNANYCVSQTDNDEKVIAVLGSLNDAIAVARYAASHDGGYGDVCIATSGHPTTHSDFDSWFTD
ncbi:TPA: hypothetical protein H2W97_004058 [Salmonella enterica]|uniref:hypothetical protein n=1 Tax=Enterobacter roggenkampii TaxID=1812935 RepID=UPI0019CA95F2|nr:hypothetical protein [Salmonella enterica subsp. enterica serovar Orion]HAK7474989.1 hypothetical protein [Salmonella enterica]EJR7832880.1 hypothetical protein [Salmonella enterica subsp. enterica serovar Orion]HAK8236164.1 hypothetical protein [Salmonella enterica]HAK8531573.1 hypothetical protein [Salmonella enterica]